MRRLLLILLLAAVPAWPQSFDGAITFQELLPYTGTGYPTGLSRTAYPASVAFPLAAGDAPASWWNADGTPSGANTLNLTGATVGQFRCIGWHGDGSCKNVLIDTEVSNNFANTKFYTGVSLALSGGTGNFGGSSLAVDNAKILSDGSACEAAGTSSGYICVNTGTMRAQVKKSGFNGFDKVVAGSTVLVNGGSDGLTVQGPDTTQPMPTAPPAPTVQAVSGGSYSTSTTFYVKVSCTGTSGGSLPSPESSVAVGSGQLLQVTAPNCVPDAGNNTYNVFARTSSGSLHLQNIQPIPTSSDWTEPTACPFAGYGCVTGRGITTYLRGPLVYAGNSDGCGDCSVAYKSSLDTGSTAVIEENGPVKAVIRVSAAVSNGTVNYLKGDQKLTFYKGQSFVRGSTLLKNADDPCPAATLSTDPCYATTHFASDYKGFSAHELRVKPAFTVANYAFSTDTTPVTGTLDGSHDAYLYQGYSSTQQSAESDATAYCMSINVSCGFPEILRYPVSGGNDYAQKGYKVVANNATQAQNTSGGSYGMGWADFTGSSGQGIQVGFWSMATEWPKALQAKWVTDHYEIRAGLLPDQTLFDATTSQPYYIAWPQYRIADTFFNFHDSNLSNAANDFLQFQYYLVGRASTADAYNRAQAFPKAYPLLDAVAVDNYMKGVGAYCPGTAGNCVADKIASNRRVYSWTQAAEGNQNDWDWQFLADFLGRGLTGRLLWAIYDSRLFMTQELPRADGFTWRSRPVGTLDTYGYPETPNNNGKYLVGNGPMTSRNWNGNVDGGGHAHFYGGPMYMYAFSGDSFLKDALDQAWGDFTLNPNVAAFTLGAQEGHGFGQARGVGIQMTHRAHYYDYARSQKRSSDASQALSIATTLMNNQLPMTMQSRGFGSNSKGVSPSTGFPALANADTTSDNTDGPLGTANISSISCNTSTNHAVVTLASNIPINVNASNFTPPQLVRVAGVPVTNVNFNGDVTLDAVTDQQHFSYPLNCGGYADSQTSGTANIPGKCPLDSNGSCNARPYTDTFMGPLITEGLVELASSTESSTSDPNAIWASHNQAADTALGIMRFEIYELLQSQTGQIGGVYWTYRDFYNADKQYTTHPSCTNNVTYSNWGLWWSLVGTVSSAEKAAFEDYISCKWVSSYSWEYGSPMLYASISHMPGFPNATWPTLVNASHSDSCVASDGDSGSPHCHLSVTVPAGATRYRIKARNDGKSIVDSLNFDNRPNPHADGSGCVEVGKYWSLSYGGSGASDYSGCYGLRPDQNWPFFSSSEVSSLPTPAGSTQDIVVNAGNYSALNTSNLALNKFAVKALTGGESLPPETSGGTVLRGTVKGGVVR